MADYKTANEAVGKDKKKNDSKKLNSYQKNMLRYRNFTARHLVPRLDEISTSKMFSNLIDISILKNSEKVQERLKKILRQINFNRLMSIAESKNSRIGRSVLIFLKESDENYKAYVANSFVSTVEPSSGKLSYLMAVMPLTAGDIQTIQVRTWVNNKIITQYKKLSEGSTLEDFTTKGDKIFEELTQEEKEERKKVGHKTKSSEDEYKGDIPAVLIENKYSKDGNFVGEPDINLDDPLVNLIDEVVIQIAWNIMYVKPRIMLNQEMGMNAYSTHGENYLNDLTESGMAITNNSFAFAMSNASDAVNFMDMSMGNLPHLNAQLIKFLQLLFEDKGFYLESANIQSNNKNDLEVLQKREAEIRIFSYKIAIRQAALQTFLAMMFQSMDDMKNENLTIDDFKVKINVQRVETEESRIKNDIMKIQSNLTDRREVLTTLNPGISQKAVEELAERLIKNNIKDIEAMPQADPVQEAKEPNIGDTSRKDNNQSGEVKKEGGK